MMEYIYEGVVEPSHKNISEPMLTMLFTSGK